MREGLLESLVHLHALGGGRTGDTRIEVSAGTQTGIRTLDRHAQCQKLHDALGGL